MMRTTNLRKAGGSVMLAVPPAILELLPLQAGTTVGIAVEDGRLVVEPKPRKRYTMAELLAASDYAQSTDDREWAEGPSVGREIL